MGEGGAGGGVCRARTVRARQTVEIHVYPSSSVTRSAAGLMRVLGRGAQSCLVLLAILSG